MRFYRHFGVVCFLSDITQITQAKIELDLNYETDFNRSNYFPQVYLICLEHFKGNRVLYITIVSKNSIRALHGNNTTFSQPTVFFAPNSTVEFFFHSQYLHLLGNNTQEVVPETLLWHLFCLVPSKVANVYVEKKIKNAYILGLGRETCMVFSCGNLIKLWALNPTVKS